MQTVILASGRGKRMGHLTLDTPKPLLRVGGKNLLQHKIDILPEDINEIILVIGHLGDQIKSFFGTNYGGKKISYVYQPTLSGTGDALWQAQNILTDRFMVMMGDDLYSAEDINSCLKHPWSILVKEVPFLQRGGRIILDQDNHLIDIIECQEHNLPNGLVNAGLYVLNKEIFNYPLVKIPNVEEYGLPQTLIQATKDVDIKIVKSKEWIEMTSPEDIDKTELLFQEDKEAL